MVITHGRALRVTGGLSSCRAHVGRAPGAVLYPALDAAAAVGAVGAPAQAAAVVEGGADEAAVGLARGARRAALVGAAIDGIGAWATAALVAGGRRVQGLAGSNKDPFPLTT